ncbi:hypothetical protein DL93DRAFT_266203 [Clavulina sp. PMI_390]|nr:hypothetical protein DL93DRAFT_266203 [Clavulina sp. PMI_390]
MIAEASRPRAVIKDGYCLTGSSMKLGKVKRKPRRRSGRIDWKTPLLFAKIQQVASLPHLSALRSPTEMLKELRRRDPCFQYLSSQVLGRMFTPGKHLPKEFSEETLEQVANRAQFSPKASSRKGILAPHPDVIDSITDTLTSLRAAGVPLNLKTVRSIIISHIEDKAPFLFTRVARDGSRFTASERWCRCFLKNELGWSVRHSTQAAQKIPDNVDELLLKAAIRQAHAIKQWNIPSELRVNSDQTQVILNEGSGLTWNKAGVKQVLCHGRDEKRAFTLLVGLSESGTLLPFQSMWSGKTAVSTPDADSDGYEQSIQEGFLYEFTKTDTYWSTIGTMKSYVVLILVPYFNGEKERLGRSPNQPCIWQIDVWPVHASDEFRTWMWNQYPWIIIFYVPAGCTGLFQPSDVGMQRILKQAISRKQTADLVEEVMQQLEREDPLPANKIKIDTRVRSLRNRSPGWLVAAHNACKDPKIVRAVRP